MLSTELATVLGWLNDVDELPADVERHARLLILDTLGCAVAGQAKPEVASLGQQLAAFDPGPVSIPGLTPELSASAAAHQVALAACWDEACEGLARAHGRPGLHTVPAVVALAAVPTSRATLGDVLTATVAGYEVAGRLGEVMRIRSGMHVDGTWGTIGAGVGAARLLEFDQDMIMSTVEALGCHLPWSQYLPVAAGATARNLYVAEAVGRGLRHALATSAGVTAPSGALDAYAENALGLSTDLRLASPGEWLVLEGYLKPFAAVRHVHYGVEAAQRWRREHVAEATEITSLRLDVYPEALTYCGNRSPKTAIQAQFSLTYGLARALLTGDLDPDAYTNEALTDPAVASLEQLVTVEALPDDGTRRARLTVGTPDGDETIVVSEVLGDPELPFGIEETVAKFKRYATPGLGETSASGFADTIVSAPLTAPWTDCLDAAR